MYKSFMENKNLVRDMAKYLNLNEDMEYIQDIYEDEDGRYVDVVQASVGFRCDGCLQDECPDYAYKCGKCAFANTRVQTYVII